MTFARFSHRLGLLTAVGVLALACGDDGGGDDTATGTGSSGGTTTDTTSGTTTDTTSSTTDTTTSSTTDPTTSTTGTGTDSDTDSDGTTGGGFNCDNVPAGPFTATEVFGNSPFAGSEDLAFDGQGNVVAKAGGDLLAVDAGGNTTATVATGLPMTVYGIRYLPNGNLVAASPGENRLMELSTGTPLDYVTGIPGVNGVQPDFDGNVWVSNFGLVVFVDTSPVAASVVDPAPNSNGIVYDADRGYIFFTNYGNGDIRRATADNQGNVGMPETVTTIAGTSPDGMALDICGNLYVVDQGGNMVYRVFLDADANIVGDVETLLDAATGDNIANAQFGVGTGWDEQTLYAIGVPGTLYAIDLQVPGAPYPIPTN